MYSLGITTKHNNQRLPDRYYTSVAKAQQYCKSLAHKELDWIKVEVDFEAYCISCADFHFWIQEIPVDDEDLKRLGYC